MSGPMVGVTKIQRGNASYWLNAVAEGGDDYYTKPGEAPGEWVGDLAAELGLAGQVDADAYAAILEGRDPVSGDQLLRRPATKVYVRPDGSERRAEPVLGYDVRFSAPKSVSLIYALGDEEIRARLLAVYDQAVREGLAHLQAQACLVARGNGGTRIERGRGLRRDGLSPPDEPGRRPGPAHPRADLEPDPRRQRRTLADPRLA